MWGGRRGKRGRRGKGGGECGGVPGGERRRECGESGRKGG